MANKKKKTEPQEEITELASDTATAVAEQDEEATKRDYKTMTIGVGERRAEKFDALMVLTKKLGCKHSDLVWLAIDKLLADPPKVAPIGSSSSASNSPGFWTNPVFGNGEGTPATAMAVIEVAKRSSMDGRTFFRFKEDEDTEKQIINRARSLSQAKRAAEFDMGMLGRAGDKVPVTLLDDDD